MFCRFCGTRLRNIGGLGFQPQYICNNAHCSSNKLRHLCCPTPSCAGAELEEIKVGIGHQMYRCQVCSFSFDTLGQMGLITCGNCNTAPQIMRSPTNGFEIKCRTCAETLDVVVK